MPNFVKIYGAQSKNTVIITFIILILTKHNNYNDNFYYHTTTYNIIIKLSFSRIFKTKSVIVFLLLTAPARNSEWSVKEFPCAADIWVGVAPCTSRPFKLAPLFAKA